MKFIIIKYVFIITSDLKLLTIIPIIPTTAKQSVPNNMNRLLMPRCLWWRYNSTNLKTVANTTRIINHKPNTLASINSTLGIDMSIKTPNTIRQTGTSWSKIFILSINHLYPRRDLNPHALRHQNLNLACLPIPPLGQHFIYYTVLIRIGQLLQRFLLEAYPAYTPRMDHQQLHHHSTLWHDHCDEQECFQRHLFVHRLYRSLCD